MPDLAIAIGGKAASTAIVELGKLAWHKWVNKERVIYNGIRSIAPADVRADTGYFYGPEGKKGERAQGNLEVRDNIIVLKRTNKEGRFHIYLERLQTGSGSSRDLEPSLDLDRRYVTFRFQARVPDRHKHVLRIAGHEVDWSTNTWTFLGDSFQSIQTSQWRAYAAAFSFDASHSAYLRIDDEDISDVPSSVYIRRLWVTVLPR